jgi:hypothetical protein
MTIPEIKYQLFKAIDRIEDEKLLTDLLNVLKNEQDNEDGFWKLLSEEQKEEINKAVKENTSPGKIISNKKLQGRILKSVTKK